MTIPALDPFVMWIVCSIAAFIVFLILGLRFGNGDELVPIMIAAPITGGVLMVVLVTIDSGLRKGFAMCGLESVFGLTALSVGVTLLAAVAWFALLGTYCLTRLILFHLEKKIPRNRGLT